MPLDELYKDIILDHYEYPRNKRHVEGDSCTCAAGNNPACGDTVDVCLTLNDEHIEDIAFEGRGCAISLASASMLTETLEGQTVGAAERWYRTVHGMLTKNPDEMDTSLELGDLEALEGVQQYPARIKCALLAWEAFHVALEQTAQPERTPRQHDAITTE